MDEKKKPNIIGRIAIVVGVLFVCYVVWHYFVVDPCLDQGGAWNYAAFKCDR